MTFSLCQFILPFSLYRTQFHHLCRLYFYKLNYKRNNKKYIKKFLSKERKWFFVFNCTSRLQKMGEKWVHYSNRVYCFLWWFKSKGFPNLAEFFQTKRKNGDRNEIEMFAVKISNSMNYVWINYQITEWIVWERVSLSFFCWKGLIKSPSLKFLSLFVTTICTYLIRQM